MTAVRIAGAAALIGLLVGCGGVVTGATPGDGGHLEGAATDDDGGASRSDGSPDATTDAGAADATSLDAGSDTALDAGPDVVCPPPPPPYEAGAPITVAGTVLSSSGVPEPLPLTVTVQGHTTSPAADGTFSIAGVTPPYDLLIEEPAFQSHVAYLGLTRPDPTLVMAATVTPGNSATVSGTVTRGGAPWAPGASQFGFAALDIGSVPQADDSASLMNAQGFFVMGGFWGGASSTVTGTVWGFAGTTLATGGVASFDAVGSLPVTLDAGDALTGVNVAIAPGGFTPTTLSGSFSVPPACLAPGFTLVMVPENLPVDQPAPDAGSFRYGTLAGPFPWFLDVQCTVPSGACSVTKGPLTGSETLSIAVPTPQTFVVAPAQNALVPASCADFAWTRTPGSIYEVSFGSGTSSYFVVTAGNSFRSPYSLPGGAYVWNVQQTAGLATVDDATASYAAGLTILPWTLVEKSGCWAKGSFSVQ